MRKLSFICVPLLLLAGQSAFAHGWQASAMWDWALNTANPKFTALESENASQQAQIDLLITNNAAQQAEIDALSAVDVSALQAQVDAMDSYVQLLQAYIEVDETTKPLQPVVRVVAANLQVVNGITGSQGDTTPNGTGNLIVGYDLGGSGPFNCTYGNHADETACVSAGYTWGQNHKSGSHNVVVGRYASYSRTNGVVGGIDNVINQTGASVSGGVDNIASGLYSSVSGGYLNTASGYVSSISGGENNTASADYSSVSGGYQNTASGVHSSVSGGLSNIASGLYSGVSGGYLNTASDIASSVSGGNLNTASGIASSVSGGADGEASGESNWVAGSLSEEN
jgi:hypothetical protein